MIYSDSLHSVRLRAHVYIWWFSVYGNEGQTTSGVCSCAGAGIGVAVVSRTHERRIERNRYSAIRLSEGQPYLGTPLLAFCEFAPLFTQYFSNLPLLQRMDVCIRAGYYEAAYSLTNYGMMLQQHTIIKNPVIKVGDMFTEFFERVGFAAYISFLRHSSFTSRALRTN